MGIFFIDPKSSNFLLNRYHANCCHTKNKIGYQDYKGKLEKI